MIWTISRTTASLKMVDPPRQQIVEDIEAVGDS